MGTLFKTILDTIGEDALKAAMIGRRLLHLPSAVDLSKVRLMDWTMLDEMLARDKVHEGRYRLFADGKKIHPQALGLVDKKGLFVPEAMQQALRQNPTIACHSVEHLFPHLWDYNCDAEAYFQTRVTTGIIASFGARQGLDLHYDKLDLIIIQTEGVKEWRFYGEPVAGSGVRRKAPSPPPPVTARVTMRPGDILFVPSGLHHQCTPLEPSLHVGLLIDWPTFLDLLDMIKDIAGTDMLLTEPIRGFLGEPSSGMQRGLRTRLLEILDRIDQRKAFPRTMAPRRRGLGLTPRPPGRITD